MEVVTLDQHLITDEGVELAKDDLTLADLSIFPGTLLHLKVSEFLGFFLFNTELLRMSLVKQTQN